MGLRRIVNSWFCLHSWVVDPIGSSKDHNTVILKCRNCFKTEAMQWRDTE